MKTDILFIVAHPDDVELCSGGTVVKHIEAGHTVGIVDLTAGELGTKGNAALRAQEASKASAIMDIKFRENLGLRDGFFDLSESNKLPVIRAIRKYKPTIVITNAIRDRHPDHGRASQLVSESCYLSGLSKIEMEQDGKVLEAWRPQQVLHMIQDNYIHPDICVDITPYMDKKMEAIMAFSSQFYNPGKEEAITPLSNPHFMEFWKSRFREMGRLIGVEFAEGYTVEGPVKMESLLR